MTINNQPIEWNQEQVKEMQDKLLAWYDQEKRLLPWRENKDPYRIWVSEIMLQQTQVITVIPYFHRFLEWFPTIKDLAEAPEDKLLKAWEGLGYYSRVRNMQHAAQTIVEKFNGEMPRDIKDILSLKGIGPYTAGAIASIAFDLPEPAVDGNVMRVYSRLFCIEDDIADPKSRKIFEQKVRETISQERPGDFNQALMDLGATICTPTSPKIEIDPLKDLYEAHKQGRMEDFPVKKKKIKTVPLYYVGLAIKNELGEYLLEKRPADGLLANMWTYPLMETDKKNYTAMEKEWQAYLEDNKEPTLFDFVAEGYSPIDGLFIEHLEQKNLDVVWQKQTLGEVKHVFSHRKWHILLAHGFLKTDSEIKLSEKQKWVHPDNFDSYVFPKPQQKMVNILEDLRNK
ncbi:A/G-specific adenine glycosylase [Vagococcus fluvialis]|uniref:A/G-specific adenine glycosylase n=1 Tax=Vagococcus fluvialis TaxID=2738 RepID=UPI001D0A4471|nr:A/G-specific adenine glycosylase [Vagococcus fluvialis]UDM70599.1 A/G-specific adenine glycosylase [Vagococcus fluvialis]UDM78019.1 A/G-specific adenine glycosylase [Vagococcus fluvialis]UDM82288.1 A/G-specific adenine glycosylase [Vagococcus fluvialis]